MDEIPSIYYVDDEPFNLTVFEELVPEHWQVKTFENPLEALENIDKDRPWLVLSDQRMPGTTGVKFLEMVKKLSPDSIRIIVTGFSDESLVVDSVRRAGIFDYIKKPWDETEFLTAIDRSIKHYVKEVEAKRLTRELEAKNKELEEKTKQLEKSIDSEKSLREELTCWVHPIVRESCLEGKAIPSKLNIFGINYDIKQSSQKVDELVRGRPVRAVVLSLFTESVLAHGGWQENHGGDAAYGHFGDKPGAAEASFNAGREFRVRIKSLCDAENIDIEVGIGLHFCPQADFEINAVTTNDVKGKTITQKCIMTNSKDIDILHRVEKLAHHLPGSNILLTKALYDSLRSPPEKLVELGLFYVDGQVDPVHVFGLLSDKVKTRDVTAIRAKKKS